MDSLSKRLSWKVLFILHNKDVSTSDVVPITTITYLRGRVQGKGFLALDASSNSFSNCSAVVITPAVALMPQCTHAERCQAGYLSGWSKTLGSAFLRNAVPKHRKAQNLNSWQKRNHSGPSFEAQKRRSEIVCKVGIPPQTGSNVIRFAVACIVHSNHTSLTIAGPREGAFPIQAATSQMLGTVAETSMKRT